MAIKEGTPLKMQAGVPYARRIRVEDGKNVWSTLDAFEVHSEVRATASVNAPLHGNLGQYMTPSFDGNDIVIDLALTGQQTRTLQSGYYDVLLTDAGSADAKGLLILFGPLTVKPVTTKVPTS